MMQPKPSIQLSHPSLKVKAVTATAAAAMQYIHFHVF
jgi:hypothetical protein